ncbi:MAG TPA: Rossmann-like and DUF2520 domain-containing protein [Gemmatimonadales bacterium]|nr:Rossmann-like and DUF2520 domain-containing protein [Gemmatimonadales bacterium]
MIAIIGGGRMGRGLAAALGDAGERVSVWSRREATGPLFAAVEGARTVLLAVRDDAIPEVAADLARLHAIERDQIVLHLSGLRDSAALGALKDTGAALGSMHPLQTIGETEGAAERLRGAYAVVEGDPRAVAEGERLARLLGLEPVRIPGPAKAAYHAAAVMASNYVVALAWVASRVAEAVGIAHADAVRMYLPLVRGAASALSEVSPEEALTGPVRRGDVATVRAHLEALGPSDRSLYARLGLETLALARRAGLERSQAEEIERLLKDY